MYLLIGLSLSAGRWEAELADDTEGAGLGDRLAQQVNERVVDARVLDASGSENKLQDASCVDVSRKDSAGLRKSSRRSPGRSHQPIVSATTELRYS